MRLVHGLHLRRFMSRPEPVLNGRLVIADDSAEMRSLVREAVGDQFGEVIEAANGRELFWTLLRSEFTAHAPANTSVIVTDQYMPEYDGLSVIGAFRELQPHAPAILITAFPSEAMQRRAAEVGAVMLAKPFSTAALRGLVRDVTGRRTGGHGDARI
jgi:CheY-like chemotaxis protein